MHWSHTLDWDEMMKPCPLADGTRVRLTEMPEDPCPVDVGELGTVTGGNGGQIWINWDNGSKLSLLPGTDKWEVV